MATQTDPQRNINIAELIQKQPILIDKKQLLRLRPLSARTIFELEKQGQFPRRFFITSRRVAWDLNEINDWVNSKKHTNMSNKDA
ncbi:AlpA family phage regulatory protein [Chitinibacter sp. FCG-7]|uniref:AlpA family phage regulatory protein n=1 Tax=Chitinibacter mangrovi TaxID=3153927 RepID=A0AAU7F9K8_9NEIS